MAEPFPDLEVAIAILLESLGQTGTITPAELQANLPFHRVRKFGGGDDRITDTARVDVDTFNTDRQTAKLTAELARQLLLAGPHRVEIPGATEEDPVTVVIVDRIRTETSAVEVPWADDRSLSRWQASYTARARR